MSYVWDVRTALSGLTMSEQSHHSELEDIALARLYLPTSKIIREDQLHACFFPDDAEPTHLSTFFSKYHMRAISAMRRMQVDESVAGAEIPIQDIEGWEDLDYGFFPENEPTVTLKEQWAYKAVGINGVLESQSAEEPQRPVFRFANLGDWMWAWDNFNPFINMNTAIKRSVASGQASEVLDFYERVSDLENHAALFRHEFDLKGPHNWPRPPHHLQGDEGSSHQPGLGELTI